MNVRRVRLAAGGLALVLTATGCGNADRGSASATTTAAPAGQDADATTPAASFPEVAAPGVSATEIRVGGVASVTNPLGGRYGTSFDGVQAYFDMVNADGGIYGRKLVLSERKDDNLANNKAEVDSLIADDIFAVLPIASVLFTGADDLVASGIPTFGWTINQEWSGTEANPKLNLFGQSGSAIGVGEKNTILPYAAQQLDAHKVGILGYTQSKSCGDSLKESVDTWGGDDLEVAYFDTSLVFGEKNLSVQVGKMKDAGVDLVATCIDTNGVVTLATEMDKQGLDAKQLLYNAYDQDFVEQYGDLFEGSVVRTDFAPFELEPDVQPDGLKKFLEWMEKSGKPATENAVAGWLNASLFADGLKAAGPDFDRQKVIDAINAMTDWNGDGFTTEVDWTKRHTQVADPNISCFALLTIEDGAFVADHGDPSKPFVCVDGTDPTKLKVVPTA